MSIARQRLGERGEDLAWTELAARGYRLRHRRFRTRHGELDIVAEEGEVVVFVEVRARESMSFGDPAASVTPQKQRQVAAMAEAYLGVHGLGHRVCRFDVVAVEADVEPPRVTVYRDAFRPGW